MVFPTETLSNFIQYTNMLVTKRIETRLGEYALKNKFNVSKKYGLPLRILVSNIFETSENDLFIH
jgi:hypothetical protein